MSHSRHIISQTSASSSRVSSVSRVEEDTSNARVTGTLRLRAEGDPSVSRNEPPARHIRWSEDVIDNEGMGKKSSKVCCIYHKARPVGESSSESESSDSDSSHSSGSDSDRDSESQYARKNCQNSHHHRNGAQKSPGRGRPSGGRSNDSKEGKRRKPSPNAYEKMPKNTKG
ncbi:phosphatase inhibitor-domain-containing protein [Aspergillus cavernicola]|uniref:Type 1 phosphatases regulator n=1 Tax=Aspergillus cavernicola TaxID=176166 RepID=A0ABR4HIZ4_9EURO